MVAGRLAGVWPVWVAPLRLSRRARPGPTQTALEFVRVVMCYGTNSEHIQYAELRAQSKSKKCLAKASELKFSNGCAPRREAQKLLPPQSGAVSALHLLPTLPQPQPRAVSDLRSLHPR